MFCKLLKIQKKLETLEIEKDDYVYFRFSVQNLHGKIVIRPIQIINVNSGKEIFIKNEFNCLSQKNSFSFGNHNSVENNQNKKLILINNENQLHLLKNEFQNLVLQENQQNPIEDLQMKNISQQFSSLFLSDQEFSNQEIYQKLFELNLS